MKISGKTGIASIIKLLLQLSIILGIAFMLFLHKITEWLNVNYDYFIKMIYPCGLVFLYLVYQFIGLFDSLKQNTPFSMNSVLKLKKASLSSFLIALLILISLLINIFCYSYYSLQFQVALSFMIILFFGVGIALYILSALFKEATLYKEENDLTI